VASFVAIYDACIFYPAQLRDLLIRVAMTDLFKARWTDQIHDEWIRRLLIDRPDIQRERLEATRTRINESVPDCLVRHYEPHIAFLSLPDPNDRHVLAAAIQAQAGVIVTLNLRDFPSSALEPYGMAAQHPDEFLAHLFDLNQATVCSAVRGMRLALQNPAKAVDEHLDNLLRCGLNRTVSLLADMRELL
jgi:predicted nucleic acid-binding protein